MPDRPRKPRIRPVGLVLIGSVGLVALLVAVTLLAHRRSLPPPYGGEGSRAAATNDVSSQPAAPTADAVSVSVVVTDPSSVRLDAFSVTASVVPVSSAAGRLDPPEDPQQVGWWYASALPGGTTGTTVLVGHVDGPSGPGALYRLVHARRGETITVANDNGQAVQFVIESLQYLTKAESLPSSLFDQNGPPRLVMISCGGTFDRVAESYDDNVVITAVPR